MSRPFSRYYENDAWISRWMFCNANMKHKTFAVKFFDRKIRKEIYGRR